MEVQLNVRLDDETAKKLNHLRDHHSINVSDFVRKAIADRLENHKEFLPGKSKK